MSIPGPRKCDAARGSSALLLLLVETAARIDTWGVFGIPAIEHSEPALEILYTHKLVSNL
jgi:hypothetical protein